MAGAGSGKTTVMAARVVWLVGTGQVAPEQVLGLTFTNKAAGELAELDVVLGVPQPLQDHLLGGRGRDPPEPLRCVVVLPDDLALLVGLRRVDRRVRGGVDDHVVALDGGEDGVTVGDVELGAPEQGHVAAEQGLDEVGAQHAAGAGDEVLGVLGRRHQRAARSLRGSHHWRLSRYHCTTSARPWAKGTWGS